MAHNGYAATTLVCRRTVDLQRGSIPILVLVQTDRIGFADCVLYDFENMGLDVIYSLCKPGVGGTFSKLKVIAVSRILGHHKVIRINVMRCTCI